MTELEWFNMKTTAVNIQEKIMYGLWTEKKRKQGDPKLKENQKFKRKEICKILNYSYIDSW